MEHFFSPEEERVWKYLIGNRLATADEVALNADVSREFAQVCIDRIGTPRDVFVNEASSMDRERGYEEPDMAEEKPTRVSMLETAKNLTGGDRNKAYGTPYDNLSDCAELWNAYINTKSACIELTADGSYTVRLKAEDVAWLMTLVKMTRSFKSGFHYDNYVDASAYSAIAGECREIEEAYNK